MRWTAGAATIEQLLRDDRLERVQGARADGRSWLDRALRTLAAAQAVTEVSTDNAFILAYDSARLACTALLIQQGLRPSTSGGHYAVEAAVRAQFGTALRAFGPLRRRRHELEYPLYATELASRDEAAEAIQAASELIEAVTKILPSLGFF